MQQIWLFYNIYVLHILFWLLDQCNHISLKYATILFLKNLLKKKTQLTTINYRVFPISHFTMQKTQRILILVFISTTVHSLLNLHVLGVVVFLFIGIYPSSSVLSLFTLLCVLSFSIINYVCSRAGISRSPTLVIAYLMKHFRMRYEQALKLVMAKRSQTLPNNGFREQLLQYPFLFFFPLSFLLSFWFLT